MTLALKFDLDAVKMYHSAKYEVSMLSILKVTAWTERQKKPHTRVQVTEAIIATVEISIQDQQANLLILPKLSNLPTPAKIKDVLTVF